MHNSELVDYIGVESSADLKPDVVYNPPPSSAAVGSESRCRRRMRSSSSSTVEKEYPPPIPWLARTENLLSHMPWVMKRYYTSDGRLIIKEEKVKRHEYFKADRSNGRLVLKLVPLGERYWREMNGGDDDDDVLDGGDEEGSDDPVVEERCKYNGGGGGFGMAVQAFPPPVHT